MHFKSASCKVLGIALLIGIVAAGSAQADVTQTAVGIQQGEQYQFSSGGGFQTGVSVQNMEQSQYARPSYRGQNIQQTSAGVQTSRQAQESLGRAQQTLIDMRSLKQNQGSRPNFNY